MIYLVPGKRGWFDCILLVDQPGNIAFTVHFLSLIGLIVLVFAFGMLAVL